MVRSVDRETERGLHLLSAKCTNCLQTTSGMWNIHLCNFGGWLLS